jgi:flagellin
MVAWRNLWTVSRKIETNIERMTTGKRINRAADDAAGFAVSSVMKARIDGLEQAKKNAQDAISYLQTASGGMTKIEDLLVRMYKLADQAATETYTSDDRLKIQEEIDELVAEIDRIASATDFNTHRPLTGEILDIHVGAGADETITITVTSVTVTALGISGLTVTGSCNTNAEDAIASLDFALSTKLLEETSLVGAFENRLSGIIDLLGTMKTSEASAYARIADLDYALETMDLSTNQILRQTSLAMMTQANVLPQAVLQLI